MDTDLPLEGDKPPSAAELGIPTVESNGHKTTAMNIDDSLPAKDEPKSATEKKDDDAPMEADDDDAVEY